MDKIKDKEKKKKRLKKRVLSYDESDFKTPRRTLLIKHKKEKKIIISIVGSIIFILLLIFLFVRRYNKYATIYIRSFATVKNAFNVDCKYTKFNNGIIRYSRDGISFIKDNGNMAWVDSYDMDNPLIEKSKDYVAIASKNGKDVHIYDLRGFVSSFESETIIDDISISDDGKVALLSHNGDSLYVYIYESGGRYGDIYFKFTREEDGEIADISFSPDGDYVMISTYVINNDKIKSKILFYNIDEKYNGENADRLYKGDPKVERFVASFDGDIDKIFNKIYFLDKKRALAVSNGDILFFDLNRKNEYISIKKTINISDTIESISVEDSSLSIITREGESVRAKLYNKDGNKLYDKNIDFDYLSYYTADSFTYFMGLDNLLILDRRGVEKYRGKLYDDMIYVKKRFGLFFYDVIVGCIGGVKRAILY